VHEGVVAARSGRVVQVDPIKPKLKLLETRRLKLNYDEPLSNVGFRFNLRRYSMGALSMGKVWSGRNCSHHVIRCYLTLKT